MYAVYFTGDGAVFDHELYELTSDPGQLENLLSGSVSGSVAAEARRLHALLTAKVEAADALPGGFDWSAATPPAVA